MALLEQTKKQDKDSKENKLPTIAKLKEYWDIMLQYYGPEHKKMRLLDMMDRGDFWKAVKQSFPKYQLLPDTNDIAYVKSNLVASIYTIMKSADIQPTSEKDKSIVMNLNIAREQIWNLSKIGMYQFKAGDRAALLNLGLTQVGWNDELTAGSGDGFYQGNVTVKNVDPMKFMRDPFSTDLDSAGYCCTYDWYHKSVFEENPLYKDTFAAYAAKHKDTPCISVPNLAIAPPMGAAKDYYLWCVFWIKEGNKFHEIHTVNFEEILATKHDIYPSSYPFAELYCNDPAGALIGTSEPAKILSNVIVTNIIDSLAFTNMYKNQNPPKFINQQSGINIKSFVDHGDEANKTFVVSGDANKAVYYHQFPDTPVALTALKQTLQYASERITGVDRKYTGRDTGSIITTGGTEEMLNRVTTIDTPKILLYQNYCMKLTQLVMANFIKHSPKRKYFYQKPNATEWLTSEVDFPHIDNKTLFNYRIDVSSELPNSKQRIAAKADMLMEKQMQYKQEGSSIQLINEEEWLSMQDLPNKEFMLERMGMQRLTDATEQVSQVLFQYANLVKQGMTPDDAILATANSLKETQMGMPPQTGPVPGVAPGGMPMGGTPMGGAPTGGGAPMPNPGMPMPI